MNADNTRQDFLSHINGLKGIAIILVILFHLTLENNRVDNCHFYRNGYLGVEIFMVIMGFLATRSFQKKSFPSFSSFVYKKTQRIIIPLTIIILITVCTAALTIDFQQVSSTGRTGFYALLGISNLELMLANSDYFASDSTLNPLLHTWYTSVALQFFILTYLFLFLTRGTSKWIKYTILSLVGMISLACHMQIEFINTLQKADWIPGSIRMMFSSYYSIIPRLWQLIAGSAIFILPNCRNNFTNNITSTTAFCALGIILFLNINTWASVVTVISSMILIKYVPNTTINNILNFPILQKFGKLSFSMFLIHMPLIALYKGTFLHSPDLITCLVLVIVTISLSLLFYIVVEKRNHKTWLILPIISISFIVTFLTWREKGLVDIIHPENDKITHSKYSDFRFSNNQSLLANFDRKAIPYRAAWQSINQNSDSTIHLDEHPFMQLGENTNPSFVLIGDSHAHMYIPGLHQICKKNKISGIAVNALILPFHNRSYKSFSLSFCQDKAKYDAFLHWIKHHPELRTIVIAISYNWIAEELIHDWNGKTDNVTPTTTAESIRPFLQEMQALNRQVVLYKALPRFDTNSMLFYARAQHRHSWLQHISLPEYDCTLEEYENRWGSIHRQFEQMEAAGLCKLAAQFFCCKISVIGAKHACELG